MWRGRRAVDGNELAKSSAVATAAPDAAAHAWGFADVVVREEPAAFEDDADLGRGVKVRSLQQHTVASGTAHRLV